MPKILNNVTQEEYDKISMEYLEEVGQEDSTQYYRFFSSIQKKLESTLEEKFKKLGIKMIREVKEEDESTMSFSKQAMRYKLVFDSDQTKTSLHPRLLNLSSILQEIRLVDPKMSQVVPDVKIIVPKYLEEKIEEITQAVVERFKFLFDQRLKAINEKLSKEGILNYDQADYALVGDQQGTQSQQV